MLREIFCSQDLYGILKINSRSRKTTIEKAWKRLMLEYDGNQTMTKDIDYAHRVLSNPVSKKQYDRFRKKNPFLYFPFV